jgi:hypothetical protein
MPDACRCFRLSAYLLAPSLRPPRLALLSVETPVSGLASSKRNAPEITMPGLGSRSAARLGMRQAFSFVLIIVCVLVCPGFLRPSNSTTTCRQHDPNPQMNREVG